MRRTRSHRRTLLDGLHRKRASSWARIGSSKSSTKSAGTGSICFRASPCGADAGNEAQHGVAKTRAKREHVETFLKWQARSAAQGRDVPLGHWACGSPVAPDCRARVTYVRFRLSAPVARRLALPNLTEQRRPRP
ncbi:hypothetical protein MRX96_003390 [Rhipicephalus microplus]